MAKPMDSHHDKLWIQNFDTQKPMRPKASDISASCKAISDWSGLHLTEILRVFDLLEHVNIKAHPKLNPNLNPKRLGIRF